METLDGTSWAVIASLVSLRLVRSGKPGLALGIPSSGHPMEGRLDMRTSAPWHVIKLGPAKNATSLNMREGLGYEMQVVQVC